MSPLPGVCDKNNFDYTNNILTKKINKIYE